MKPVLPLFLIALAACSPSDSVATESSSSPNPSPLPQASTTPSEVKSSSSAAPSAVASPSSKIDHIYSGTAYLKGLGIDANGDYESHINFEGKSTLFPDDKLQLDLSLQCGVIAPEPYQTSKTIIQLNPKTKTWKQLSDEYEDCLGNKGTLYENEDEQYQPYTVEDLGDQVKFNLGTNSPEETYHFKDLYGVTLNKQAVDPE